MYLNEELDIGLYLNLVKYGDTNMHVYSLHETVQKNNSTLDKHRFEHLTSITFNIIDPLAYM